MICDECLLEVIVRICGGCEVKRVEHGGCSGDDVMTACSGFAGEENWVARCPCWMGGDK